MSVNSDIASQGDPSPEPKGSTRSGEGSEVLRPVPRPAPVAPPTPVNTGIASRGARLPNRMVRLVHVLPLSKSRCFGFAGGR